MHLQNAEHQRSVDDLNLVDLVRVVINRWRFVAAGALLIGAAAFGASFLMTPQFTAKTTFLPPQGNSGSALNAALSSLGPLAGLGAGAGNGKSAETYVAILNSRTVGDRLVEHHKLKELYKAKYQFEAFDALKSRTRIEYSRRDGIISLEFDDTDPVRAAKVANDYVNELKVLTSSMALTEAQRRRAFFEDQLNKAKKTLAEAQAALQGSGFDSGALRAEPRAAAEEYGRIKAQLTTIEVTLDAARSRLADSSPEVKGMAATASSLRQRLQALEHETDPTRKQDYVSRYREFKYQEALYEQLAKQFEAARMEESREDNTIQVIDPALTPEWKSKPKRASIGLAATLIAALILSAAVIARWLSNLGRQSTTTQYTSRTN